MTEPIAYLNGNFLPQSQVHLGINDAGFVWGATVTDLVRTFRHQLFRLDAHLVRFRNSAKLARVPLEADDDQLAFVAQELVRHNAKRIEPTQDLCLCMFATPGPIGYYLGQPGGPGDGPPTLCMHTFPVPFGRYARLIREGARLIIPESRQLPPKCVSPTIKHRSRLHWWLAEQEVRQLDHQMQTGNEEVRISGAQRRSLPLPPAAALLRDTQGRITETAAANFLVSRGAHVLSPPRVKGDRVLPGISLMIVEELCQELGITFEEADLQEEDCNRAQEAMLASTVYCLAPVSQINLTMIPWPGPVFQQLIAAWNRKVGLDIWGQICSEADRAPSP